jgi:hypothetical protein
MSKNVLRTMAKRTVQFLTLSGGTDSTVIDMKDYNGLLVSITPAVIAGDVTAYKIYAYSNAALSADETLIVTGAAFPTAVGDVAFLETSDAEISGKGPGLDLRYCKVEVTGNDTDKIVLAIEQGLPHFPGDGLTADVIT